MKTLIIICFLLLAAFVLTVGGLGLALLGGFIMAPFS